MIRTEETTQLVRTSLEGLEMPASRQEIVEWARRRQAPALAIQVILQLPDRRYRNWDQVMLALGQLVA